MMKFHLSTFRDLSLMAIIFYMACLRSFLLLFNDDISFVDFSRPVNDGDYFVYGVFALMVTYHLRACLK